MVSLHRKVGWLLNSFLPSSYFVLMSILNRLFHFFMCCSGGKDLSGNKRTNKNHSFDQKFEKFNLALQISCLQGYPVRVVR